MLGMVSRTRLHLGFVGVSRTIKSMQHKLAFLRNPRYASPPARGTSPSKASAHHEWGTVEASHKRPPSLKVGGLSFGLLACSQVLALTSIIVLCFRSASRHMCKQVGHCGSISQAPTFPQGAYCPRKLV